MSETYVRWPLASTQIIFVVKPRLKCPLPYLDKTVPVCLVNVRRWFVIHLARSEALSPEGFVARASRWSTAMRAGACALIAMACCGALGLLVAGVRGVRSPSTFFMSSSREKLLEEIEATYAKQGVQPETVTKVIETFRQTWDKNGQQEVRGLPALQPPG